MYRTCVGDYDFILNLIIFFWYLLNLDNKYMLRTNITISRFINIQVKHKLTLT